MGDALNIDFLDLSGAVNFELPPAAAISFFKAKGLKPTFAWQDMVGEEHAKAFTVAKIMDADLLGQVRSAVDKAIETGQPIAMFRAELEPLLRAKGWWGTKEVIDPLTGAATSAKLGSAHRLNTIFRTNIQSSYAVGHWQTVQRIKAVAPFLMYDAVDDHRTRPEHKKLDGLVLPVDHPFWKTHYPPNGWNCRCSAIQMTKKQLKDFTGKDTVDAAPKVETAPWTNPRTGKVLQVPTDLDPGWDMNVGEVYPAALNTTLGEKIAALPADLAAALKKVEHGKYAAQAAANAAALEAEIAKAAADVEAALAAQVAQKKAAADLAGQAKLDEIKAGSLIGTGKAYPNALSKLSKAGELDGLSPAQAWAAVATKADELIAYHKLSTKVGAYKKAVLAGKTPTKAQIAAFEALDDAGKAKALADIAKKQAAAAPPAAPVAAAVEPAAMGTPAGGGPAWSDLTQIGEQSGSNPGGLFQDVGTGQKWYVKIPASEDAARNEVLAGKLYEALGIEAPELHIIAHPDGTAVASKIIDKLTNGGKRIVDWSRIAGAHEGFAADAWLANWDVVGLSFDNLLVKSARAVRVDTGGALRYRAQGGLKGSAFGRQVDELDSLRDGTNAQAKKVFGAISTDALESGVRRVLALSDTEIRRIVAEFGPTDTKAAGELADLLIARKRNIAERFPHLSEPAKAAEVVKAPSGRLYATEHKQIKASRSNGYGVASDKDHIEDQEVLVWQEADASGDILTSAWLKVRGEGEALVAAQMPGGGASFTTLDDRIMTAVRGIASRSAKGEALEAKDFSRVREAVQEWAEVQTKLTALANAGAIEGASVQRAYRHYQSWIDALDSATTGRAAGDVATWDAAVGFFEGLPPPTGKGISRTGLLEAKELRHGRAKQVAGDLSAASKFAEVEIGDVKLRYWGDDAPWALRGQVQLVTKGGAIEDADRLFATLDKIGVPSGAPSALDREELYLVQIMNHANDHDAIARMGLLHDQADRVVFGRAHVAGRAGVDSVDQLPLYRPEGVRQSFESGRQHRFRPDLDKTEFAKLQRSHLLHHNITNGSVLDGLHAILNGGGQMAPTVDKMRRGIMPAGMSPDADLGTGGAAYFFTRIKSRAAALKNEGFVWRSKLLARTDAISYDGDRYGRTTGNHVRENRKTGVDEWREASRNPSNETIFKNSLSIFDELEAIVVRNETEKQAAIAMLKEAKIDRWPDGRTLEDVVKVKK